MGPCEWLDIEDHFFGNTNCQYWQLFSHGLIKFFRGIFQSPALQTGGGVYKIGSVFWELRGRKLSSAENTRFQFHWFPYLLLLPPSRASWVHDIQKIIHLAGERREEPKYSSFTLTIQLLQPQLIYMISEIAGSSSKIFVELWKTD